MISLNGYASQILTGALLTVELALAGLLLAFVLGLFGASAKLSKSGILRGLGNTYTTLVRGVPDLVLMLLLFYGLQIILNSFTDWIGFKQIQIDPFTAGVVTVGAIYGAYFTETFRGARLALAQGTVEAAQAFGMPSGMIFRRIIYPQMMRLALPGIANNWQAVLKATALVSLIGLTDLVRITQNAGRGTSRPMFFAMLSGGFYLAISSISSIGFWYLRRRFSTGFARNKS